MEISYLGLHNILHGRVSLWTSIFFISLLLVTVKFKISIFILLKPGMYKNQIDDKKDSQEE